jgi:tetratricopeptide (TPR) repeat protein
MTNFGTMRYKHIISVVLWSMFLVACGPDRRVALAEKLMAEKETDSAIAVMQEIKEPQNNLTDRDYALYALLLSEAMHRKQQLNAETDTLLLPAIKYFSESGDSLYAERALYCKAHLDRRLYRMKDAMQSFLKALLFLQGSGNDEQLYRVNTWLGVVCLNQEEYEGKMRYSKEALKAALRMDNLFYKNLALCDIATGYYFLNRLDSALYYAQAAYDAAIADSLPSQLPHVYTDLGSIYAKMGENGKALEYIDKAIGLRPRKDTLAILGLYADKVDLFGKLGQYDSAYHYFRKAVASPNLATQADAYNHMSGAYYKMGRCNEAYSLLLRFTELADSVRKQRHTAEVIALQELYKHEQLSVENLYWRTQAAERQSNVYLMATLSLLSLWIASTIYFFYWRNRRRLVEQQHQLASQQEELHHQRQVTTENLQRMAEMEQKEARLKETFFRRLNQRIVQEIEKGSNILLSDDDWEDIVQNADIIFDNFTRRLQQHYPALNKEDLRYCCMVKMQLSQLEMSQIMHLEKDSVKKRLKRIRMEKMKADSGVTLEELWVNVKT